MPTYNERQDLANQFADSVARMRSCLLAAGKQVEDDDIVHAWADYSDGLCAGWLMPPEKDEDLLAILLKHLPPTGKRWSMRLADLGDASGDCMLPFPAELLASMGWKEGNMLRVTVEEPGKLVVERLD